MPTGKLSKHHVVESTWILLPSVRCLAAVPLHMPRRKAAWLSNQPFQRSACSSKTLRKGHTSQALQPPSPEAPGTDNVARLYTDTSTCQCNLLHCAADPIPLTAELEALIGKTLREIQVLENQDRC